MLKFPPGDVTFTKLLLAFALLGMIVIVIYDSIVIPGRSIPDIVVSTFGGIIGWLINSQGSQQNAKQAADTLQKTAELAPLMTAASNATSTSSSPTGTNTQTTSNAPPIPPTT